MSPYVKEAEMYFRAPQGSVSLPKVQAMSGSWAAIYDSVFLATRDESSRGTLAARTSDAQASASRPKVRSVEHGAAEIGEERSSRGWGTWGFRRRAEAPDVAGKRCTSTTANL